MISVALYFALLAVAGTASPSLATPSTSVSPSQFTATASPALSHEQRAALLVERLVKVCSAHPEVERAFVLSQQASDGTTSYMFIPIFDRKVSDEALSEADAAYQEIFPSSGHLPLMLLARNQWKRSLAGASPIYIRPSK